MLWGRTLPALVDPDRAQDLETATIHPEGDVVHQVSLRHGDPDATGDVVVDGTYEIAAHDPAFPGPEAEPAGDGQAVLARLHYRHHATAEGELVKVEAEILVDGGVYPSSDPAVVGEAARVAAGPYRVRNVVIDAAVVRTSDAPGTGPTMGTLPVSFGHESQMDRLAATLGLDPVELRLRNALHPGDLLPTGQPLTTARPVAQLVQAAVTHPLPPDVHDRPDAPVTDEADWLSLPGGVGRTADPGRVRRGIGVAVGYETRLDGEDGDGATEALVQLHQGVATVTCGATGVDPGSNTVAAQIARTALGCQDVVLEPAGTLPAGSAGSAPASRPAGVSAGAVRRACRLVAEQVREKLASCVRLPVEALSLTDHGRIVSTDGTVDVTVAAAAADDLVEASAVPSPAPAPRRVEPGQAGAAHGLVVAAHRAVVDVDVDLGLMRVVQVATVADVPEAAAAGIDVWEPEPPFGSESKAEAVTGSSTAAIVAAVRAASGVDVTRVPVRPWDLV